MKGRCGGRLVDKGATSVRRLRLEGLYQGRRGLAVDEGAGRIRRRIDRLELSLGAKLFIRRKTGYEATEVGQRAMALSEHIESAIRNGQAEINGDCTHLTGSVRVGAPDGFGSYFLAPRLGPL